MTDGEKMARYARPAELGDDHDGFIGYDDTRWWVGNDRTSYSTEEALAVINAMLADLLFGQV
jgi:hypothetical protein